MVFVPYVLDVGFGTLVLHHNYDVAAQLALIDFEVLTLSARLHEVELRRPLRRRCRLASLHARPTLVHIISIDTMRSMFGKATMAWCFGAAVAVAACGEKKPAVEPHCDPPQAGQMTELAAQAKRVFDAGRWADAANAFKLVAEGNAGDDEGNRQIAAYHRGIALYRAGQKAESRAQFEAVAATPCHLKQKEAPRAGARQEEVALPRSDQMAFSNLP